MDGADIKVILAIIFIRLVCFFLLESPIYEGKQNGKVGHVLLRIQDISSVVYLKGGKEITHLVIGCDEDAGRWLIAYHARSA